MAKAYFYRVGIDGSFGGFWAPLEGNFHFIPIPEPKGSKSAQTYTYSNLTCSDLIPIDFLKEIPHLDPFFPSMVNKQNDEAPSFGEPYKGEFIGNRTRSMLLSKLNASDILFFWTSLRPMRCWYKKQLTRNELKKGQISCLPHEKGVYLIGHLKVKDVFKMSCLREIEWKHCPSNAHTLRARAGQIEEGYVVIGEAESQNGWLKGSMLYKKPVLITRPKQFANGKWPVTLEWLDRFTGLGEKQWVRGFKKCEINNVGELLDKIEGNWNKEKGDGSILK